MKTNYSDIFRDLPNEEFQNKRPFKIGGVTFYEGIVFKKESSIGGITFGMLIDKDIEIKGGAFDIPSIVGIY